MLKFFLQTSLIAALLGALGISLNADTLNDVQATLHKLYGMARGTGITGSEPAVAATDHAAAALRAISNGASEQGVPPPGGIAGRAFDNRVPQECYGERIIEIEGKVHCNHERRQAAP